MMHKLKMPMGLVMAGLVIGLSCGRMPFTHQNLRAGDPAAKADPPATAKEALAPFNSLIGEWRGVGRPKRSERKDLWTEEALWKWDFRDQQVAIQYIVSKTDRWLKSARLSYDPTTGKYQVLAEFSEGIRRAYVGEFRNNQLTVESGPDKEGDIYELKITLLNDKRTLVTHSRRRAPSTLSVSLADVGYTRAGVRLAVEGAGQPTCIVTGGYGSISVQHAGKTYYVCCSGCKQAFDDDPVGIIAEAKAKTVNAKD